MPKKTSKKSSIITRKQKKAAADISEYGDVSSNAEFAKEYLENPNKSDADPTEYRVIKLPNGLVVTLMSTERNQSEHDEDDPAVNRQEEPKCQPPDSNKGEAIRESTLAKKLMEIGDGVLDAAHCSLSINVGSFSDPAHAPLISTILQNVILISSQKYPQENSFVNFLNNSAGIVNINCRASELTYFSFRVPFPVFDEALDRFSNCFANPCLRRASITEFRNVLTTDSDVLLTEDFAEHKRRLFMALVSKNNPGKLCLKRTNRQLYERLGDGLCAEVEAFMKRHYSAHRMKVVLQAGKPLDTLEQYARKYFSRLPTNGLPPVDLSSYSFDQCFNMRAFNMIYQANAERDVDKDAIDFCWIMPSCQKHYRTKPVRYIASMFHSVLRGSLNHYLHERNWGITVQALEENNDFQSNSIYHLYAFCIQLTPEGKQNLKKVLDAVYSFINFLKAKGTEKHVYDEVRRIAEARFRVDADNLVAKNVRTLRKSMHLYPSVDYLTGDFVYHDYDPEIIKTFLDCMSPDKTLILMYDDEMMRLCLSNDVDSDSEDEGRGMLKRMRLPKKWINHWKTIKPLPCFQFPEPNIFCPDDFSLVPVPPKISNFPVKIHSDSAYEVWHQSNGIFRSPSCQITLCYLTDIPVQSVESVTMIDALAMCSQRFLKEKMHLASVVGMQCTVRSLEGKLIIDLTGTRQKLSLLALTIAEFIGNCSVIVTEELLSDAKDDLFLFWNADTPIVTGVLAHDIQASILDNMHWTFAEKFAAYRKITLEKFKYFFQHFIKNGYVRSLVSGNIEASDALDIVRHFTAVLKCGARKTKTALTHGIKEIPRGSQCCRVQRLCSNRTYHCVINHYQIGKYSPTKAAAVILLMTLHENPMFSKFRASHNFKISDIEVAVPKYLQNSALLGYSVLAKNFNSTPDFAGDNIRIEAYRRAVKNMLEKLSPIEWEILRTTIVKIKEAPTWLSQAVINKTEVNFAQFRFDRNQKQAEAFARLSLKDLSKLMIGMVETDGTTRKLSVQVIGHVESKDEQQKSKVSPSNFEWKNVTEATSNWEFDNFITDISAYKRELRTMKKKLKKMKYSNLEVQYSRAV